jgi:hypothetical protein
MLRITIIVLVLFSSVLFAIENSWYEVNSPEFLNSVRGYSGNDQTYSATSDSEGNLIIAGYFEGKIHFDNIMLVSNGDKDLFVAKRDPSGNWLWAKNAGGESADYALDVCTDENDNVYITGYFYDQAYFGNLNIESTGVSEIFVASLDSDGSWGWAVSAGGTSFERGNAIVAGAGAVFVSGNFQSTAFFGADSLVSNGNRDIFLAKLDYSGNWKSVTGFGSSSNDDVNDIIVAGNDRIVLAGYFNNEMTVNSELLTSAGQYDGFIAIADTSLAFLNAKRFGGSLRDEFRSITSNEDVIYATGYFTGTADFDELEATSGGGRDVFVAKLDTNLNFSDVITAYSSQDDEGRGIIYDNSNLYLTGYFRSNADFGENTISSNGDKDVFIATVNSDFEWDLVNSGGSSSVDESIAIAKSGDEICVVSNFFRNAVYGSYQNESEGGFDMIIINADISDLSWSSAEKLFGFSDIAESFDINRDVMGNKYIAGRFYGMLNFGSKILNALDASDGFIAKSGPAGEYIWVKPIICDGDATIYAVDTDDEMNVYVCGSFSGDARFGSIEKETEGLLDFFVGKLNSEGNWLWVETGGNFLFDEAMDIAYYDDEHIFITGYYSYSVEFGDDELAGGSASDIFVASIDTDGNWQWAKRAGGGGYDSGEGVAADSSGNCIIVGSYEVDADFGEHEVISYGNDDFFISKLSPDGEWLWANSSGSNTWRDEAYDVQTDSEDNIYVAGQFSRFATFEDRYLISEGDVDAFVVQLNSDGNWGFINSFGGKSYDSGSGLFVSDDELYFTGTFTDTLLADNQSYYSQSGRDIFSAKLDISDGSIEWLVTATGSNNDNSVGIVKDTRGNLHLLGNFIDSVSIADYTLTNNTSVDKKFMLASYGKKTPPHTWNFKPNTASSSTVIIPDSINPKINGQDFTEYDAVGIYYLKNNKKVFGGFAHWNNETLEIDVWHDDMNTNFNDGFIDDSTYRYELWDYETENTYNTNVYYQSGPDYFSADSSSVIKYLPKPEEDSLIISLNRGWNLISSYVIPYDTSIESVFDGVEEDIATVKDSYYFYIPKFSLKTFNSWDYKKVYKVFAINDTEFQISGFYFPNTSYTINLTEGWNFLPYLYKNAIEANEFFEVLTNNEILIIAKDDEGNLFIPSLNINNLGDLQPGEGYYIYVNQEYDFILPGQ